jgi:hypothetical protein
MTLGIDLSLRSTGLFFKGEYEAFKLITPKKIDEEELIIKMTSEICDFIDEHKPTKIGLEGLSFNSVSSSKDIIAGNFWYLRATIFQKYPDIKVEIIPVLTWRNPLFSKADNKIFTLDKKLLATTKKEQNYDKMSRAEKLHFAGEYRELILNANIKYLTYLKLPENVKALFSKYSYGDGLFDLTDAYWICDYINK